LRAKGTTLRVVILPEVVNRVNQQNLRFLFFGYWHSYQSMGALMAAIMSAPLARINYFLAARQTPKC